jgi:hypothetical protein
MWELYFNICFAVINKEKTIGKSTYNKEVINESAEKE